MEATDREGAGGGPGGRDTPPRDDWPIAELLDHRLMRLMLGIALGLPVSGMAALGAIYGFALGFGGVVGGKNPAVGVISLAVTLLALAGLAGAWRRIFRPRARMSDREARTVRSLLTAGVLASIVMGAVSVVFANSWGSLAVFAFIALMGLLLRAGTPLVMPPPFASRRPPPAGDLPPASPTSP